MSKKSERPTLQDKFPIYLDGRLSKTLVSALPGASEGIHRKTINCTIFKNGTVSPVNNKNVTVYGHCDDALCVKTRWNLGSRHEGFPVVIFDGQCSVYAEVRRKRARLGNLSTFSRT